ncbi:MAG: hypothetical protein WBP22_02130 [Candidatus Saccharimonas sp.]
MRIEADIDVLENVLRRRGDLLDILLIDRTTGKNIIWATDSYKAYGKEFAPKAPMKPELVTGVYGKLIQPRAAKSLVEQRQRTKEKAEVFTPLNIVDQMNKQVDWSGGIKVVDKSNWQQYVRELKLEITCGEAPFIVSRYNPTVHGAHIKDIKRRVGFLDRKLRAVNEFCHTKEEWLYWAKEAYKASYGYEWQGDNLLIARENLLYTLIDYYKDKFGKAPTLAVQQEFAEIISWNIWQMDGIKYVVPMSCKHEIHVIPGLPLFNEPDTVEKDECEGCKFNRPFKHNGRYAVVMDWERSRREKFVNLLQKDV